MDVINEEAHIIQVKSKRKNSDWRDYMVFNNAERSVKQYEDMVARPHHHMLDRRDVRLIYRVTKEVGIYSTIKE